MKFTFRTDETIYQTLLCDIKHDNLNSTPFIFRNHQDGLLNPSLKFAQTFCVKIFDTVNVFY